MMLETGTKCCQRCQLKPIPTEFAERSHETVHMYIIKNSYLRLTIFYKENNVTLQKQISKTLKFLFIKNNLRKEYKMFESKNSIKDIYKFKIFKNPVTLQYNYVLNKIVKCIYRNKECNFCGKIA